MKKIFLLLTILLLNNCATIITKGEAFPGMYEENPISILVMPPINNTTAADAKEYYVTTIAEPVSYSGYYVFPIEVVNEVLKQEGIYDTELIVNLDLSKFKDFFGADAVLYTKIIKWATSYYVIGGNVTVHIFYELKSTSTGKTLWSYNDAVTVDTSGDNYSDSVPGIAGLLLSLAETAVKTATQDYIPLAKKANTTVLNTIPFGVYHTGYGTDKNLQAVVKNRILEDKENKENN